jgi:hypothetical protein
MTVYISIENGTMFDEVDNQYQGGWSMFFKNSYFTHFLFRLGSILCCRVISSEPLDGTRNKDILSSLAK